MKINRLVALIGGCLYASVIAATASADDTEIFFNTSDVEIRPNLLFVLDNSGSMSADVTTTTSPYDSAVTYSGAYSADYVYFSGGGRRATLRSILKSASTCGDLNTALARTGYLLNYRMAYLYSGWWSSWEELDDSNITSRTECEADGDLDISWWRYDARDIYSANYLNWYFSRVTTTQTRMEIVQGVAKDLADSLSGVNIGLMAFNTDGDKSNGGRVLIPIGNVADNREAFKTAVDALSPATNTPLSETLFGALRYFSGLAPFLDDAPVASTVAEGKYVSPIDYACQSNNIIFLTDGEPTCDGDPSCDGTGFDTDTHDDADSLAAMELLVGDCTGNCLDEIANHMQVEDIYTGFAGNQTVTTYTVGFHSAQTLLQDAATKGGGEYYTPTNADTLQEVFEEIIRSVLAVNTTFVAPGVAVNSFNRLNHLDTLYFSVFQPEISPRWNGNLKRYRLGADGIIYDSESAVAVDAATGFFRDSAKSWWSAAADGPDVRLGGAVEQQVDDNNTRKVVTYTGSNLALTHASNAVDVSNSTNLTASMFGDAAMSDSDRVRLIKWTRGLDVDDSDNDGSATDARKYIADPLHSVPHLVIYGGTESQPDTTVFFGDNQGFIHAVNGNSGDTYFSFIPTELLDNQRILYNNSRARTDHVYGMDGSIISWQHDEDDDGQINAVDNDHLYIYGGMRRGGRSYYALDATTRTAPKMLWSITGGAGDFVELGQTWSKPVKTRIQTASNSVKEVLIFAGGYDTDQDDVTVRTVDDVGRALYIVDASTGARLWWAGPAASGANLELTDMKYSIPASPKVLDLTGDGLADQIYVGDMGGQIWRFDITQYTKESIFGVTAGVIADLAGTTTETNRRFYHSPDLFGLEVGTQEYLGLVIGSGWQAHPLNEVIDDRIYMLRIANVHEAPVNTLVPPEVDYTTVKVTESDLFDTTLNLIKEGTDAEQQQAQTDLANAKGWYIQLTNAGEKVLSASQTIGGQVFITTYEPNRNNSTCLPGTGTSRLYHLNVKDGTAVANYDEIGSADDLTRDDRIVVLSTLGLPPDPQRMRVDGKDIICVGAECRSVDSVTGVIETYWYEE